MCRRKKPPRTHWGAIHSCKATQEEKKEAEDALKHFDALTNEPDRKRFPN